MPTTRTLTTEDYNDLLTWLDRKNEVRARTKEAARQLILCTAKDNDIKGLPKATTLGFTTGGDRQRILHIRMELEGKRIALADGNEYQFVIPRPQGGQYFFTLTLAVAVSQVRSFWHQHLRSSAALSLFVFERLFFRIGNCYVRSLNVNSNSPEDVDKLCSELHLDRNKLDSNIRLRPSLHYLSSGETAGAILLQKTFGDVFDRRCILNSGGTFRRTTNDIIFASSRDDENILRTTGHFLPNARGFGEFADDNQGSPRSVNVLVRREVYKGNIATLISSQHGRASEGVCAKLCNAEWLEANIAPLFGSTGVVPEIFEIVFAVGLKYAEFGHYSYADTVEVRPDGYWTPAHDRSRR